MVEARAARDVASGESWAFTEHRSQDDLQSDELDDGFPYEHIGNEIELLLTQTGWIAPTPFMVVALKQLLSALIKIYGRNGHWLLREIGRDNLRDMRFVENLGLAYYFGIYASALKALPDDELKRLGFRE